MLSFARAGAIIMAKSNSGAGKQPAPTGARLRPDHKDGPQRIRSSGKRWSDASEAIFLNHLAATCNVTWAARQAGFTEMTAYYHRRKDAGFAHRWDAALDHGYARLEIELVRTATDYLAGYAIDPDTPIRPMTVREAILILGMHRRRGGENGVRGRFKAVPPSLDQVRDSILLKLEKIAAHGRK